MGREETRRDECWSRPRNPTCIINYSPPSTSDNNITTRKICIPSFPSFPTLLYFFFSLSETHIHIHTYIRFVVGIVILVARFMVDYLAGSSDI